MGLLEGSAILQYVWSGPIVLAVLAVVVATRFLRTLSKRKSRQTSPVPKLQPNKQDLGADVDQPMEIEPVFENLPNFRQAGGRQLMNRHGQRVRDGLLFRSSRTDFITEEERAIFNRLGIKAIVDLRRKQEYETAEGEKILDDEYPPYVLKKGKVSELKPSLRWGGGLRKRAKARKGNDGTAAPTSPHRGKRYLVNMVTMDLIWFIFSQVNFFIRYLTLILVLVDWLFGCHLFVKFFSWAVLNRISIPQQYVNLLEYTKPAVADIFKLLIEGENLPVLIHCAHGKDRTGVIVALILSCLEVEEDLIVQDYALSEAGLLSIKDRLYREIVEKYGYKEDALRADADTMREVLSELKRRYGSISKYLEAAGFSLEEQERLREIFLEPSESDAED